MQFTDLIFRTVKRVARPYSVIFRRVCTRANECIICMCEAGDYARRNVRNTRSHVNRVLITEGNVGVLYRGVFQKFFFFPNL